MESQEENVEMEQDNITEIKSLPKTKKKTVEPGVIYLSRIPNGMTVRSFKEILGRYGTITHCYLQPDEKTVTKKGRKYSEGWIEYSDKKISKRVALSLNCQRVGIKKRSKWYDELWNMKYLSNFKWFHLTERLEYERALREQKLRKEVTQAKKETSFHIQNIGKSKKMRKMEKKKKEKPEEFKDDQKPDRLFSYKLKDTENEILARKTSRNNDSLKSFNPDNYVNPKSVKANTSFLKNIFSGGL
ncbi:hypothetical protein SNE40_019449 [Patella caerulea]|uniref:Activator of basal transcription 1 n=2 Tax=Patella caerulea TaxID=87958 RepID=A0AAN8J6I0_PATCE